MGGGVKMRWIKVGTLIGLGLVSAAGGCSNGSDAPAEAREAVDASYAPIT